MKLCRRCLLDLEERRILREMAHSPGRRSLENIFREMSRYNYLRRKAEEHQEKRLKEREKRIKEFQQKLKGYEDLLSYQAMDSLLQGEDLEEIARRIDEDRERRELEEKIASLRWQPNGITGKDLEEVLREYQEKGYIDIEEGKIKITPRGANILARGALEEILKNLTRKGAGPHPIEEIGSGSELSTYSRPYEFGDDYNFVDIEKTLLKALERGREVSLQEEDFEIFETIHQSKMCAGLIIDESGSMRYNDKMEGAIDTSLALSALIRREPRDSLRVFIFSSQVKEIPYWDITNAVVSGGSTDIRAAMQAFRRAIINEEGDKQAYLITDTEPNTEEGRYVGFDRAMRGVLEEASRYREEGITLNIIMLDENPRLREFASILARKNLGRVFFTTSQNLGEAIIEDYLASKKQRMYKRSY